jgi:hypothetical protein
MPVLELSEEVTMAAERSFEAIFGWLEAQIAHDREKEAFHAQQEAFHREQKAVFTAELEKLTAILESFRSAADTRRWTSPAGRRRGLPSRRAATSAAASRP